MLKGSTVFLYPTGVRFIFSLNHFLSALILLQIKMELNSSQNFQGFAYVLLW